MSKIIKNNYTVEKTLDYDEFLEKRCKFPHSLVYYETDVFNKASRTTVCFDGAYRTKVMYCENCDETHTNQMGMEVELRNYESTERNLNEVFSFGCYNSNLQAHISKVICKKCGSSYNLEDIRIIEHYRHARDSSIRAVYDTVYNDDGLVKLSMKVCTMVVERGFYSVDNKYKLIFNTKTGQTYLYNNPQNKKNKIQPLDFKMSLENIYLRAHEFDFLFNRCLFDAENQKEYKINKIKEIYNLLYENICNNLGYSPKTLEEYAKELGYSKEEDIYTFKVLALYNRFPNLNPFGILGFGSPYSLKVQLFKKMKRIKNTSQNPLLELANLYNIKHFDLFEKCFMEGTRKLLWLVYFSMFFKEKEHLEKLLEKYEDSKGIMSMPEEVDKMVNRRNSIYNATSLFFKDIRKSMNEDNLCLIIGEYIDNYSVKCGIDDLAELYYVSKQVNRKIKIDIQYICNVLCGIINEKCIDEVQKDVEKYIYKELNKASYMGNKKFFKFKLSTVDGYYENMKIGCKKK